MLDQHFFKKKFDQYFETSDQYFSENVGSTFKKILKIEKSWAVLL
jgi:hypothetical protein